MEKTVIDIKNLCSNCMTRAKARPVATQLIECVQKEKALAVNLDNVEILSFSFLDELIFWLAASANMRNVTFRTNNPSVKEKLARIVAIRKVLLYYQYNNKAVTLLEPKKLKKYKSFLQPLKDKLTL